MNIKAKIVAAFRSFPLLFGGVLFSAGIIFWGGFNWSMELTNTEDFCISCHEMRENVYREYRQSIHFENGSGVRASCPDCHVPKVWKDKVVRKVGASNELFHKAVGSIDSREKFLKKRLELAEHVWESMASNDSLECRNCHEIDSMSSLKQSSMASRSHIVAAANSLTCIDCHKGIAHQLPETFLDDKHEKFEHKEIACDLCHTGLSPKPDWGEWSEE
ncbi:MAG: NapC/NirT family cytochrome c [Spongiibacteraceae bacterium]